jgi:hypothetical protein
MIVAPHRGGRNRHGRLSLMAEIVAMLEQTLKAERDQKNALRLEKARSEHLLRVQANADLRASEARIRMEMDRAFRAIVEGTAGTIGGDFFMSLVEHLATALGVDSCAGLYITIPLSSETAPKTIAVV